MRRADELNQSDRERPEFLKIQQLYQLHLSENVHLSAVTEIHPITEVEAHQLWVYRKDVTFWGQQIASLANHVRGLTQLTCLPFLWALDSRCQLTVTKPTVSGLAQVVGERMARRVTRVLSEHDCANYSPGFGDADVWVIMADIMLEKADSQSLLDSWTDEDDKALVREVRYAN